MAKEHYPQIIVDIPRQKEMFNFEGIDGVGKSEQRDRVIPVLDGLGIKAKAVSAPSTTAVGAFLRENLRTLQPWERSNLFVLDMIRTLKDNEDYDGILIWDRYKDSNIVSNKDMAPEESARWVEELPDPLKTFLLDMPPQDIVSKRGESLHDHSLDIEWQELKRHRYYDLVEKEPERFIIVNADQDKEIVTTTIVKGITDVLRKIRSLRLELR